VMVTPVDQKDLGLHALERARGGDAAESTTQYDHAFCGHGQ